MHAIDLIDLWDLTEKEWKEIGGKISLPWQCAECGKQYKDKNDAEQCCKDKDDYM